MQEAHRLHVEKKEASVSMNGIAAEAAERNGLVKQQMNRLKDYAYYHGSGWDNGDPLTLAKGAKFPDRVSPCFRKLAQVITDCQEAGCLEWLDEYFDALASRGITVTVDPKAPVAKDPDDVKSAVVAMKSYQAVICSNADEIVELGTTAEDMSFAPKQKFKELVGLYDRVNDGKDVDDFVQDRVAFCELYESAVNRVHDGV
jgi:hypothetical protein